MGELTHLVAQVMPAVELEAAEWWWAVPNLAASCHWPQQTSIPCHAVDIINLKVRLCNVNCSCP